MSEMDKLKRFADRAIIELEGLVDWQKAAIVLLATKHEHQLSYEQIAEELGISPVTLYRFRQRKEISDYVARFTTARVIDSLPAIVNKQVEMAVSRGSVKSAELLMKYAGLLVERRAVEADIRANVDSIADKDNDQLQVELEELRRKLEAGPAE